jgi:uncharacterized protein (TIGR03086 family)
MNTTQRTEPTSSRRGSAVVTLPSDTEILITRAFDAPKALVWEAVTRPEHVLRWWGPEWSPLESCEIDLRVGGTWRYVSRLDGNELAWSGEYRQIDPPDSITSTECFEGYPDAVSLNTMTLTEEAGVTTLQTLVRHSSKEHRDGHLNSGMEGGMQQTFDRLDTLLVAFDSEAERFRRIAGRFSDVLAAVDALPGDAWSRPAHNDGWDAKSPVVHLVQWVPGLFGSAGLDVAPSTDPDVDAVAAWEEMRVKLQAVLDDPEVAAGDVDLGPAGRHTVARGIEQFVTGDVVVHVWDVATAAGLELPNEQLVDAQMAEQMVPAMRAIGDMLVASGHYKPAVAVPAGASIQDQLLAATGRDPHWRPTRGVASG